MRFDIVDAPQRSPEWFAARRGRLTGTGASDMLARIKTGEAAAKRDLKARLVVERLTNESQENGYINAEMQRGIDKEPDALAAYEARTNLLVRSTGFLSCSELMAGCSLDGHIGDFDGIVELKCPKSATHLRYLRENKPPSDYLPQITHNLWISGAAWCDFVSFDDRFPPSLRLFITRVHRGYVDLMAYEGAARAFLQEVDTEFRAVQALMEAIDGQAVA